MFTKLVAVFYLALNFCKHKHCLRFLYITKNCKLLTASWLWHPEFGWPLEIYWTGIRRAINGIVEISFIVVWRSHYWTIGIVLHILFMSQINKNLPVGLGSESISETCQRFHKMKQTKLCLSYTCVYQIKKYWFKKKKACHTV